MFSGEFTKCWEFTFARMEPRDLRGPGSIFTYRDSTPFEMACGLCINSADLKVIDYLGYGLLRVDSTGTFFDLN